MRATVTFSLLLAGCGPPTPVPNGATPSASVSGTALSPAAIERARMMVGPALTERDVPGAAIVVLDGEEVRIAQGYGLTDIAGPEPVNAATVFQLGSISKQFLAALVLALARNGQLSLDDPVSYHLDGFTHLPRTLRIRHLLNHTSGLRDFFVTAEALAAFDDLTRPRAELHAFVRRAPLDFEPGMRWSYSNTGYALLAMLVERITGRPYEVALADRFFGPFGLRSLRQCTPLPRDANEARGHERRGKAIVLAAPENMEWIRGDGGLCGHAVDLARWTYLLSTGAVLPTPLYEQMVAPTRLRGGREADYGLGLSLVDLDGIRKVAHNGAMRGFSATAAYYPDRALTVVVLANRGDVRTEAIERALARALLQIPDPDLRPRELPPAERDRMLGSYDIGPFEARIVDRDGRLWLEMPPPGPTTPLRYLGSGELASDEEPDAHRVRFPAGASPAGELRLLMGGMYWYGRRVEPRR